MEKTPGFPWIDKLLLLNDAEVDYFWGKPYLRNFQQLFVVVKRGDVTLILFIKDVLLLSSWCEASPSLAFIY